VSARCKKVKANLGLGRNAPPLDQGDRASVLVDFPADEVALRIKMIADLAVDGSEFLERLPLKFEHRCFSSSKRLVGIFGSIALLKLKSDGGKSNEQDSKDRLAASHLDFP
jgi:hypothetical protein